MTFSVSAKTRAALILLSGVILGGIGNAIQPLVGLGVITPIVATVAGIAIPFAVTEINSGAITLGDLENFGSELITALTKSGKLTATQQEAANIAQAAITAAQNKTA